MRKEYKKWTKEEEEELIKLFVIEGKTKNEICIILNRGYNSIKKKLKFLNLKCTKEQIFKSKRFALSGEKNGMYGKKSWSNGQTKENNSILKNSSEKISKIRIQMFKDGTLPNLSGSNNPMYGKDSWCKGKTKDDNEILMNISEKAKVRKKLYWKNLPEEEKNRQITMLIKNIHLMNINKKNTSIEIKIKNYLLNDLHLVLEKDFFFQYPHGKFIYDFYFPAHNLVLECFGDYYHANPLKYENKILNKMQLNNIIRDNRKKQFLEENKINFMFFWEYDINNNFKNIKEQIKNILNMN